MIDVHVIRSAFLLGLCLRAGALSAAPPVFEPVLADGGASAVLRLPDDLAEVARYRLVLEQAPPGARLTRDGAGGRILSWPVSPGAGIETEIVFAVTAGEGAEPSERRRLRVRRSGRESVPGAPARALPRAADATPGTAFETAFDAAFDAVPGAAPGATPGAALGAALGTTPDAVSAIGTARAAAGTDGRAEWRSRPARAPALGAAPSDDGMPDARTPPTRASTEPASRRGNTAPALGRIGPQRLVVGRRWQLHVRVRDADGDEPVFFTAGLPETATFERGSGGWLVLGWTPTAESIGRVDVTLGAADGRDARLRTERVVRLDVLPDADGAAPPVDAPTTTPTTTPTAIPATPASAPLIEPLAAQVVSTGRTVSFRAVARLDDGRRPQLSIDRLPRRAGFYENADGSRTFHWPTQKSDQGEHLFGITAVHPDDDTLRSHIETLVIVGDPSLTRTTPSEPTGPPGVATLSPGIATLERTDDASDADEPPYYAPPADVYWSDSPRGERYGAGDDRGYGEADRGGETLTYDGGGFLPESGYPEDVGRYPGDGEPFEEASYFDDTEEEPGMGYAYPDDGREYFLGADGVAVDADGNPVGEFRFGE